MISRWAKDSNRKLCPIASNWIGSWYNLNIKQYKEEIAIPSLANNKIIFS